MKFLALGLVLISQFSFAADYTPGKYKIDPAHSRAEFVVDHLVISNVSGRFNEISGEINLEDKFSQSQVIVSIPTSSIDTAVKMRDDDLKSARFFDVAKYPVMKFKSKAILGTTKLFRLTGDLTIKDVTKEVVFNSKYTGHAKNMQGKEIIAVQGTTKINRKDFHISYNEQTPLGPAVGDEVEITIRIEAVKE